MQPRATVACLVLLLGTTACGAAAGSGPAPVGAASTRTSIEGEAARVASPANNGLIGLAAWERGAARESPEHTPAAPPGGLDWLAAQQGADGGWRDAELTGRVLLAYLGAGYTHRGRHPFAKVVARGLRFLKRSQDAEGWFAGDADDDPGTRLLGHVLATAAMVEAYGMTESPIFRGSAQKALDALAKACADDDPRLRDRAVAAGALRALYAAREIAADREARGRRARLEADPAAFAALAVFARADPWSEPVDLALAILARRAGERGVSDRVTGVQGDVATLDVSTADVVLAHGLLEVVDDPAGALARIAETLPPGGLLSLLVAQRHAAVLARAMAGHFPQARALLDSPESEPHRYTAEEITAMLAAAGFAPPTLHAIQVFGDLVPSTLLELEPGSTPA